MTSVVCATVTPSPAATPPALLFNEGLDPGVRVSLDDRLGETATICFVEKDAAFAHIRLDRTGQRIRLESWRLALLP